MSTDITTWLNTPLPPAARIAVVLPALAVAAWILSRPIFVGEGSRFSRSVLAFMLNPRRDPIDRPASWAVICGRCGELDEPLEKRSHALQVGILHLDLNPGHLTEVAQRR